MERSQLSKTIGRVALAATVVIFINWIYGIRFRYQLLVACGWLALVIIDACIIDPDGHSASDFVIVTMDEVVILLLVGAVYLALGIVLGLGLSIWHWCNPFTMIDYWVHTHHWVVWLMFTVVAGVLGLGVPTMAAHAIDQAMQLSLWFAIAGLLTGVQLWRRERPWRRFLYDSTQPLPQR